jgi:hypothetical protein
LATGEAIGHSGDVLNSEALGFGRPAGGSQGFWQMDWLGSVKLNECSQERDDLIGLMAAFGS